ncbi:MAG: ParB/RepB/Spo0J family partition protein, partial [Cellulomonas sp.]|nr:ParB/RepB/Spo0J family partition protein [Cellulomonas sp.]
DTDDEPSGHYQAVIGHRGAAAAKLAGLNSVPAIVDETLTPAQQLELMLVENVQRADLSPIEEADGYQGLLDLGLDVDAIARETGRSESTVRRRLRLGSLPEKAREKLHTGQATLAQADRLSDFEDDPELVEQLAKVLGSADFENELAKATKKVMIARAVARVVDALQAAGATPIPLREHGEYQGYAPDGMVQVGYISRWELQQGSQSQKVANWLEHYLSDVDATCVFRTFHNTYDDNVYLFRPRSEPSAGDQPATPAVDPEWERQQAERRAAVAAQAERHERFTGLRRAFVDGLKARSITTQQVAILAGFVARRDLMWVWTSFDTYGVDKKLLAWLGIEPFGNATSDDEDDAVVAAAIAALDTGHALLALAVLGEEDGLCSDNYPTARVGAYYELLQQLGYAACSEEVDALTERPADEADEADVDDEGFYDAADDVDDDEGDED